MKVLPTNDFEKIQSGDISAYEKIFKDYYSFLCRQAFKILNDADEAEEIVQEIFVRIWNKRQEISINSSLKNYLIQSVKNRCFNHIKHHAVRREYSNEYSKEQNFIDDANPLITSELDKKIEKAINRLPVERKKIFLMSRQEGLKYKEIADALGISIKTVENQMGKALKHLREELVEYLTIAIILFIETLNNL